MKNEILELLLSGAVQVLGIDASEISKDTLFTELDMKSVQLSQIAISIEDEYDVEIPFMDLKRQNNFDEAAEMIADIIED